MATRVVVEGDSIPPEDQLKKIANQIWESGNKGYDELTVFMATEVAAIIIKSIPTLLNARIMKHAIEEKGIWKKKRQKKKVG